MTTETRYLGMTATQIERAKMADAQASARDEFWASAIQKLGSNSASNAFADLEDFIASGRMNERQLRSLASALRSISQKASDAAAVVQERRKFPFKFRA